LQDDGDALPRLSREEAALNATVTGSQLIASKDASMVSGRRF
jgi:hypothetical protein